MLIKSLEALNFRKYNKLSVYDIPEAGIITVEGLNESGKTSIGEAICFALFGRTFFLDQSNLKKVVCWGSDVAEVTLTFKAAKGEIYTLWRSVNRQNEVDVKLFQHDSLNKIIDEESVLAGDEKVSEALSKLLGFDFDAFSNSFYLAQRELTSPDPQSDSIKQMAGIAAYAKITDDLEIDNQRNANSILELEPQVVTNQEKLDEINLDETWLPELIDADETLGTEQRGRESLVGQLLENKPVYASNHPEYHAAKKSSGTLGILSKLFFVISAILWILWIVNRFYPEAFIEFMLNNFGDAALTSFSGFAENLLLPTAILTSLAAIACWVMRKNAHSKMQALDTEAKDFSRLLEDGHSYVTTLAESLLPERVVQLLHERASDPSTLQVLPPREQFNNLNQLMTNSVGYKADPEEMSAATSRLTDALKKQDGEVASISNTILDDINQEKTRADQAGNIRSTLQNLTKVIDKCNYSIETQTIGMGIMQRAAADSIENFNQNIATLSASALPNFTENRYSKMKIAEDFSVQIYSDEKNDYMDFDEISSGTQRQVMLALRIAMSEQLSRNTGNEEQFIFLDEPFAFFDHARTLSTIDALPQISDVIKQIWISAQEFPQPINAAKYIVCPPDQTELIV